MTINLLGLHGSSGRPAFIEEFITRLAPQLRYRCPQGTFADGDGYTFFKRNPDFGVPAETLLALAKDSVSVDGFVTQDDRERTIIVGYSSNAIFGEALLAVAPESYVGAILLRPQPIAEDFVFPNLSNKPVLVLSGEHDTRRQPQHAVQLVAQLSLAGAQVTHHDLETGHALSLDGDDMTLATAWMQQFPTAI